MEEITKKLIKVQNSLKVPKDLKNDFAGFNYRNAEGILEAVKPLAEKEGLSVLLGDEVVNVGERNYVKATVEITDGTNTIKTTAFAREQQEKKGMDQAQITGAASSYARKYALSGLFALDDSSNDPDAKDNSETPDKPTDKQIKYLETIAKTKFEFEGTVGTTLDIMSNQVIGRSVKTKQDADELFNALKLEGIIEE